MILVLLLVNATLPAALRLSSRLNLIRTDRELISCKSLKSKIYASLALMTSFGEARACPDCRCSSHCARHRRRARHRPRNRGRACARRRNGHGARPQSRDTRRGIASGTAHFAGVAECRGPGRRQRRDCGGRGAAADRYADSKCLALAELRAVRKIRCGAVSADDGYQLHGRGSHHPGRVAFDDERPSLRPHCRGCIHPLVSRAMPMSAPTGAAKPRPLFGLVPPPWRCGTGEHGA